MSRPAAKVQEIYDYLLYSFKRIYDIERTKKFKRSTKVRFPSKESIIAFIYGTSKYIDSSSYTQDSLQPDQISVSRNTIRKAISQLILDNKIQLTKEGYQYIPQLEDKMSMHPVLDIASKVPIRIGYIENMLLLTVGNGLSVSVSEYLSSQFYAEDIIFLPMGKHIMCLGILPSTIMNQPEKISTPYDSYNLMCQRIEAALHQFEVLHRDFPYKNLYETEYMAKQHPEVMATLMKIASSFSGDAHTSYTWIQRAITESHYAKRAEDPEGWDEEVEDGCY